MAGQPGPVARRAAVLGSPIAHSLSPVLHRAAYAELGLAWEYDAIEVDEASFPAFLAQFRSDPAWAGVSLTMPLKDAALAAADDVSEVAARTAAVNTLIPRNGRLSGENTDPEGIRWACQRAGVAAGTGGSATVIGAGATARSAVAGLAALGVRRISVLARRPEAVPDVAECASRFAMEVQAVAWADPADALAAPVVVSTVPKGAADALSEGLPAAPGVLLDVVYSPWPTVLAAAWSQRGGRVISGLDMLVGQAARQVELMTGLPAPIDVMYAAGQAALGR